MTTEEIELRMAAFEALNDSSRSFNRDNRMFWKGVRRDLKRLGIEMTTPVRDIGQPFTLTFRNNVSGAVSTFDWRPPEERP